MKLSQDQHAFISGGASGIGLGLVDALLKRGLSVSIADIDQESLNAALASRRDRCFGVVLDVRDRQSWASAKSQAESTFGPVDILANNAGITFDGRDCADLDSEAFARVVDVDLTGVFNGVSAFGAGLRARGKGHIVNTASIMGLLTGQAGMGVYSAAKAAVVALSEALRAEMAPHGVGVSILCPGLVKSNIRANTLKLGGEAKNLALRTASQQIVGMEPADAAECVVRGIERDLPYIFTHPQLLKHLETRVAYILESAARGAA